MTAIYTTVLHDLQENTLKDLDVWFCLETNIKPLVRALAPAIGHMR